MVFVDSALLHSGGSDSRSAGDHAHQAAQHLSRGELVPQMFGDFASADAFHAATESIHAHHMRLLFGHRDILAAVGHSAFVAATEFTSMDENNATSVRAVWCNSVT
ncbi:DUF2563 family protein [Mycobacterium sp. ML4]